jgi:hypothetical protein
MVIPNIRINIIKEGAVNNLLYLIKLYYISLPTSSKFYSWYNSNKMFCIRKAFLLQEILFQIKGTTLTCKLQSYCSKLRLTFFH